MDGEDKQTAYVQERLAKVMRLGIDQALNGIQNVCLFSCHDLHKDDDRWKAVAEQAKRALAELLTLQVQFDLIVGHTKTRDEDND